MGTTVAIWKNIPAKRENDFGLENALAGYVRRRWPDKTVSYVQHEWGLSESEAAKVVYANASKNTLNKLLHHRRGGFALFLHLLEDATATKLSDFIEQQAQVAAREAKTWAAEEARLEALATRVSERRRGDRSVA